MLFGFIGIDGIVEFSISKIFPHFRRKLFQEFFETADTQGISNFCNKSGFIYISLCIQHRPQIVFAAVKFFKQNSL